MKILLIITANFFAAMFFFLATFAYLNIEIFANLANAEGVAVSVAIACATVVGITAFPFIVVMSIVELISGE